MGKKKFLISLLLLMMNPVVTVFGQDVSTDAISETSQVEETQEQTETSVEAAVSNLKIVNVKFDKEKHQFTLEFDQDISLKTDALDKLKVRVEQEEDTEPVLISSKANLKVDEEDQAGETVIIEEIDEEFLYELVGKEIIFTFEDENIENEYLDVSEPFSLDDPELVEEKEIWTLKKEVQEEITDSVDLSNEQKVQVINNLDELSSEQEINALLAESLALVETTEETTTTVEPTTTTEATTTKEPTTTTETTTTTVEPTTTTKATTTTEEPTTTTETTTTTEEPTTTTEATTTTEEPTTTTETTTTTEEPTTTTEATTTTEEPKTTTETTTTTKESTTTTEATTTTEEPTTTTEDTTTTEEPTTTTEATTTTEEPTTTTDATTTTKEPSTTTETTTTKEPTTTTEATTTTEEPTTTTETTTTTEERAFTTNTTLPAPTPSDTANRKTSLDNVSGVALTFAGDDVGKIGSFKVEFKNTLANNTIDKYDIQIFDGNGRVVKNVNPIQVSIPVRKDTDQVPTRVVYLENDRIIEEIPFVVKDNNVIFYAQHFSTYGVEYGQAKSGQKTSQEITTTTVEKKDKLPVSGEQSSFLIYLIASILLVASYTLINKVKKQDTKL